jgi:hypothetical protein
VTSKIGIIAVGYQCKNLNQILEPWIKLKKLYNQNIYISVTTALFKEYWDLGKKYDNQEMENACVNLLENKDIDYFNVIKEPILDFESRNYCWNDLKDKNLDLVWQLDLYDEHYSYEEILKTINWIENNNLYDAYRINFKNYFGNINDKKYILDFNPPRINWVKKYNNIKRWYWDNWVEYNNGQKSELLCDYTIPYTICNPKHLSWVGDKDFLLNKIKYQHKALGCCSYTWDDKEDTLKFDLNYYLKYNIPIPKVYIDE